MLVPDNGFWLDSEQCGEVGADFPMKGRRLQVRNVPDVLADKSVVPLGETERIFEFRARAENAWRTERGGQGGKAGRFGYIPSGPASKQGLALRRRAHHRIIHPDENVPVMQ